MFRRVLEAFGGGALFKWEKKIYEEKKKKLEEAKKKKLEEEKKKLLGSDIKNSEKLESDSKRRPVLEGVLKHKGRKSSSKKS